MVKKDLNKIRRAFKPDSERLYIRCLARAYARVSQEEKKLVSLELIDFDSLEEEEQELYLLSAKKALSGKNGKNLFELELTDTPKRQELESLSSVLWSEETLRPFLEGLLECEQEACNLFINGFQCEYRLSRDESVNFFLMAFHQARASGQFLYFDHGQQSVRKSDTSQMQLNPSLYQALVYPVIDHHGADLSLALYQSGSRGLPDEALLEFLGAQCCMSADEQQSAFTEVLGEVSDGQITLQTLQALRHQVEYIQESADPDEEAPSLDSVDLEEILRASGVREERLEEFDDLYQQVIGEERLQVENILPVKKMSLKMEGISLSADAQAIDRLSVRSIDGKNYLAIELHEDLEVNQIPVSVSRSCTGQADLPEENLSDTDQPMEGPDPEEA